MRFTISFVFVSVLAAPPAHTAPVVNDVSGVFAHGERVTISGTGFGSKATATPLVWDNFEDGAAGNNIENQSAAVGKWDTSAHSGAAEYHASNGLDGSRSALCKYWQGTGTYTCDLAKNFPSGIDKLFFSYWFRYTRVNVPSRNWKPFRFYSDDDQRQAYLQYYCEKNGAQWVLYGSATNHYFDDFINELPQPGTWHHIEVLFEESDYSSSNGTFQIYFDGMDLGQSNANPVSIGNTQTVGPGDPSDPFTQLRFPHYWAEDGVPGCPANGGADFFIDDAYVDTSWARIELADSPVYAQATVKALQVPRAWSGSSIEIDVNTSQFESGQTVYLFVTDDNNARNSTPVTLTVDGVAVVRPNAPNNLAVE